MVSRWGLLTIISLFFLFIIHIQSANAYCTNNVCAGPYSDPTNEYCNGVCEIGENIDFCSDCTEAFCGDNKCDQGKGETFLTCADCLAQNGGFCSSNAECLSDNCFQGTTTKTCQPVGYCATDANCKADKRGGSKGNVCSVGDVYEEFEWVDYSCDTGSNTCKTDTTGTVLSDNPISVCNDAVGCDASTNNCFGCTPNDYSYSCVVNTNSIYYFDKCNVQQSPKENCNDISIVNTINWNSWTCEAGTNNRVRSGNKYTGFCTAGANSCATTPTSSSEDCGFAGCSAGACKNPPVTCNGAPSCLTVGNQQCSAAGVQTCTLNNNLNCLEWVTTTACVGATPDCQNNACVAGPCTTTCQINQPTNTHIVTGSCTTGSCYECNNGFEWSGSGCVATCVDTDNDGYCASVDCNDGNAAIHPGAVEVCNGLDDNCVNGVDEGVVDPVREVACVSGVGGCHAGTMKRVCLNGAWENKYCSNDGPAPTYYTDVDGDDHGNPVSSSCMLGNGFEDIPGDDCDDQDKNNYPGNTEVCDGKVNNCIGKKEVDCEGVYCADQARCVRSPEKISERFERVKCQEEKIERFNYFIPLSCAETYSTCTYDIDPKDNRTGTYQPVDDGIVCGNNGYCNAGVCSGACPSDNIPGCQATTAEGFIPLDGYGCPQGLSCYKCTDNLVWKDGKCVQNNTHINKVY